MQANAYINCRNPSESEAIFNKLEIIIYREKTKTSRNPSESEAIFNIFYFW